ncbi:glycosyltransferase [Gryllotalpicola sp.]|uniref:glycosyltransferase family 2 protein n=1 Tax=Gryllotalpicola sp. TaxID=1932787 RepID=UPI00261FCB79|nr:glycosyltransferase [Gryllotalpicola sp.]
MTTTPRAGVIIATRDRPEALRSALEAAHRALGVTHVEYIVVDQSEDEASHDICSRFPNVQYVRSTSVGIAHNRNLGAERTRSEWVLFLDDDAVLSEHFGHELERVLVRAERLSLVAPLYLDPIGMPLAQVAPDRAVRLGASHVWCVIGICLLVRRADLFRLGGFDERLGVGRRWGSSEETDLVLRFIEEGRGCIVEPSLVVMHPRAAERGRGSRRRAFRYGLGTGALVRLHALRSDDPAWRREARSFMLHPLWEIVHGPARRRTTLRVAELFGRWLGLLFGPNPPQTGGRIAHSVACIRALAKAKVRPMGSGHG